MRLFQEICMQRLGHIGSDLFDNVARGKQAPLGGFIASLSLITFPEGQVQAPEQSQGSLPLGRHPGTLKEFLGFAGPVERGEGFAAQPCQTEDVATLAGLCGGRHELLDDL
jgi:hypothetical protein